MTRRWRVRAAERPVRRRANPPSSTIIQSQDWMIFYVWWMRTTCFIENAAKRLCFFFSLLGTVNHLLCGNWSTA